VAGALDAAHDAGLVHRDVKPGNVLIEERESGDHVYLTDFGVSKRSSELTEAERETGLTFEGQVVGTAAYLAPEQIERGSSDRRADIYSLACVAFHVLTGRPPFPRVTELGTLVAHAREDRPAAGEVNPALPPPVDDVLRRGMAVDPDARPGSATELVGELELALGSGSRRRKPAGRLRRRSPAALIAAGLAIAAVLVTGLLILGSDDGGSPPPASEARSRPQVDTVPLATGSSPVGLAADGGTAFVASRDARQTGGGLAGAIDRLAIGPAKLQGDSIPIPSPRSLAAREGELWVVNGEALYRVGEDGADSLRIEVGGKPDDVATGGDSVWVTDEDGDAVSRFDAGAAQPVAQEVAVGDEPRSVAATPSAAWVAVAGEGVVARVDARTMRVQERIPVGPRPTSVAVGGGSVWVADNAENTLREIDPRTNRVLGAPIDVAPSPRGVAYGDGSVWVASGAANVVERFDPSTRTRIGRPIPVGANPADVVSAGGTIITANQTGSSVSLIRP
jgi:DNA-binding beta-propeller fold protein YncE